MTAATSTTIDDALERARVTVTDPTEFDVGAALRRLASDAGRSAPATDTARAAQAGHRLTTVCRWMINAPGAAGHIDRLAVPLPETTFDVEGAAVFACLLHLTGHPHSAQFWWQLSAGAGHRVSAYCLHLHHLSLGESREAAHWRYEVTDARSGTESIDDVLLGCLETVATYVRKNGSDASTPPTGLLEMEVDRLAGDGSNPILSRPDRRLADCLRDFTSR
ncbi:hypothetical protein [Streptomyces sp. NBC_01012]|uniref:hypothetical protein n=1 Tax=Streptomyces sp. NBC_01012 TaxID=2903717 RepID=UPI003867A39E|nr:hypothetical protein OG623_11920 [Streptomyces sp. NBC_01012]